MMVVPGMPGIVPGTLRCRADWWCAATPQRGGGTARHTDRHRAHHACRSRGAAYQRDGFREVTRCQCMVASDNLSAVLIGLLFNPTEGPNMNYDPNTPNPAPAPQPAPPPPPPEPQERDERDDGLPPFLGGAA